MNWRQRVKIFADKNIKGSDKSETSGTISYSVHWYHVHKIVQFDEIAQADELSFCARLL